MTTYQYGIKNKFVPTALAPKAYGWKGGANYRSADVPASLVSSSGLTPDILRQQFAYEWFQSGSAERGWTPGPNMSNPPFTSGAAGRLHPLLVNNRGMPARILRGYIRRSEYDPEPMSLSRARLYFMYNPETITRDYVSYLEQSALDPFNTVYQSGNLIAPPSILNFNFELFFDRQEEATDEKFPGVFVDYQFFDLVVRNVVPSDPNSTSNTLPDNGVMMVNPRDITVVFSPQLTVQGRPTNAQVTFEKFTHRMTPVRMRIQLTILASYFGPVRDMVQYRKEELPAEQAISLEEEYVDPFNFTWINVQDDSTGDGDGSTEFDEQIGEANDGNHKIRLDALKWAINHVVAGGPGDGAYYGSGTHTDYTGEYAGAGRHALPRGADCSGLVTEAYIQVGHGGTMGWEGHPGTSTIMSTIRSEVCIYKPLGEIGLVGLLPGDILIRDGHVGFLVSTAGGNITVFDASSSQVTPEVGSRLKEGWGSFTHLIRPTPLGALTSAASASDYNSSTTVYSTGQSAIPGGS